MVGILSSPLANYTSDMLLPLAARGLVEGNTYKAFSYMGALARDGSSSIANNAIVGVGWICKVASNGTLAPAQNGSEGGWQAATSATSGGSSGILGAIARVDGDWTMVCRVIPNSAANQTVIIGLGPLDTVGTDGNNIIAWRISDTGTIVGVCDAAGVETTRDTGVTPDGTTEHVLRIEVRGGGTIVRFHRNGFQVGADVTTNIPAGTTQPQLQVGIKNSTTVTKTLVGFDVAAWREV